MRNIISISLWGVDPMYTYGMIENLQRWPKVYPGWEFWIYADENVSHQLLDVYTALGARVILSGCNTNSSGLYWRMRPVMDCLADHVIIRDADSRIGPRESACVKQWTDSGKAVHCIRDHRFHTSPLMGGLWGCRPDDLHKLLPGISKQWADYLDRVCSGMVTSGRYGRHVNSDQCFLYEYIWGRLDKEDHIMVHDDLKHFGGELPFPSANPSPMDFCGQVYIPPNQGKFKP